MARVKWTEGAIGDLEHIRRYVSAFQLTAANRLAARIGEVVSDLADAPGDMDAIRERAVIHPYRLRYRLVDGMLVVLGLRHGSDARIG